MWLKTLHVWAVREPDAVWARMQSSHQQPLTRPSDSLPDISAAVISGVRTVTPLYCWHHRGLRLVCVCVFIRETPIIIGPFFLLNTGAFARGALRAFTCRVSHKCSQHWACCPDFAHTCIHFPSQHTPPHPKSSLPHHSSIEGNKLLWNLRVRIKLSSR